jgi:hypothetical protein
LSQWLKFLKFLNAFHNVSIGDDVFSGELSSLLSLRLLLNLLFLILGLFDGGLELLPLALAVSLCVLHGMMMSDGLNDYFRQYIERLIV